jgi:hypothetical protein
MTTLDTKSRSGWVTFSGVLVFIVGAMNLIWGIAALEKKSLFNERGLVYSNLEFFAWFFIVIGALQILTAFLLFFRRPFGLMLAILGASVGILIAFFSLGAYPEWAITVMVVDGLVIYGVCGHMDDFA